MNETDHAEQLETLFMALADKTRLRLLHLMVDGEVSVGHFTAALGDSQPKVSRHLAYLRSAGLVDTRRDGKSIYYSLRWPVDAGPFQIVRKTLEALQNSHTPTEPTEHPLNIIEKNNLISAEPYIIEKRRQAHNDLEEFLL